MTTTIKARTMRAGMGLLAAAGIALAGLTALPAGEAAARPCPMPREPGEERPVCSIGRAQVYAGLGRSGEEIPTRHPVLAGGLAGGIGGDSRSIVIPQ